MLKPDAVHRGYCRATEFTGCDAQCGFGASDGGADAAGGHVERRGDLGVAEAAVPEHEGHGLLAGQPAEGCPDAGARSLDSVRQE